MSTLKTARRLYNNSLSIRKKLFHNLNIKKKKNKCNISVTIYVSGEVSNRFYVNDSAFDCLHFVLSSSKFVLLLCAPHKREREEGERCQRRISGPVINNC